MTPFGYLSRTNHSKNPQFCALVLALGAFCGGLGTGCGRSEGEPAPIEIVVPTEAATLDPRFSTRALDIKLTRLVHAGLIGLDPDSLEPVGLAAESWEYENDATLHLVLRPGLRFHSGHPLSPSDVCATIAALDDPQLGSPHRAVVRAIGRCQPDGTRGVTVHLKAPRATLLTDLEVPILRADQATLPPDPHGKLDGLGPYRISSVRPGTVHLEPSDTGIEPRARSPVVVRTVRDENARALRLLAGKSDIAPNAISPALLPALEDRPGLTVRARRGANVTYLLMQNDRAPFDRPDVRRAVARAIDREKIVSTLLAGRGQVASWIFPEGHWAHADGLSAEPFDLPRARNTLSGLPEVTLLTSTDRARLTIARAIAQMLGDAGLQVQVVPLDLGVMLERMDAGDFSMATLQMPELTEPNILKWFFHPGGVPGEGGEGKNRARYRNPAAGRYLDLASETRDVPTRRRHYAALARLMERDMPVVPLWHEDQVAVVSPRAKGFSLSAEGRWLDVARVPAGEQ